MSLPSALLASLKNIKGFDEAAFIRVHASGEQVVSIRMNPAKKIDPTAEKEQGEKVPWCATGFYLGQRPSFTLDPLFHAGAYYVQEASSMFLEEAMKQAIDLSQPLRVLDLCAAPGGKSTLIQSLISEDSLLVSNEVIKTRVNILAENISKWGAANVIVTNNDPKDFQRLPGFFDVIVVDAPCSGSGLFRKDPEAINEWSEQNVELCSQRQQRILADIAGSLKEGGTLIYSTCSYTEKEDETICDWFLENDSFSSVQYSLKKEWGIVETNSPGKNAFGYRFYPDKLKGEGFFIAAFKKIKEDIKYGKEGKGKARSEKITAKEAAVIQPYLQNPADFFLFKQNEMVIALPAIFENDLAAIQSALYIKKAGVKIGTVIRDELIPDHELAMSTIRNNDIPFVETDLENALQYLRRQDIKRDAARKGWSLIGYQQLPLGWIKILPNRVNNYYPKDWRILNK